MLDEIVISAADVARSNAILTSRASAQAVKIAEGLRFAALDELIAQMRGSTLTGDVQQHFIDLLTERSKGLINTMADTTANEALALGRHDEMTIFAQDIEVATYTSLLDENTCDPCSEADGIEVPFGSAEYERLRPPFRECDSADAPGGNRCRCQMVLTLKTEAPSGPISISPLSPFPPYPPVAPRGEFPPSLPTPTTPVLPREVPTRIEPPVAPPVAAPPPVVAPLPVVVPEPVLPDFERYVLKELTPDQRNAAIARVAANNSKGWDEARLRQEIDKAEEAVQAQADTLDQFEQRSEEWRAHRIALRDKWVDEAYGKGSKPLPGERPQAYIYMGPPGAGKSTIERGIKADLERRGIAIPVTVDADEFKVRMPEYNGGLGANATHKESVLLAKTLRERALANGDNVSLAIVGKTYSKAGGEGGLLETVNDLRTKGYDVHVRLVNISPETAVDRTLTRFVGTGRYVNPRYVYQEVDSLPEQSYSRLVREHPEMLASHEAFNNTARAGAVPYHPEIETSRALAQAVREDGGFTYDPRSTVQPREGFAVSPYKEAGAGRTGERVITDGPHLAEEIANYADENRQLLGQPGHFLGAWRDTDGKVYLDVSIVSKTEQEALAVAKANGQRAYYNLATHETVELPTVPSAGAAAAPAPTPAGPPRAGPEGDSGLRGGD